jgi:hypothetical protein
MAREEAETAPLRKPCHDARNREISPVAGTND